MTDNAAEQNEAEVAALQEKIDELKAAVEKTEQQQKKLGDLNDQLEQANKSVEDKTQALKDAKAKQDEAKKALDDAQAKLEAMGMDEYEAAKKTSRTRGQSSMTPIRPLLLHRTIWTRPRLPRPAPSRKSRIPRQL